MYPKTLDTYFIVLGTLMRLSNVPQYNVIEFLAQFLSVN